MNTRSYKQNCALAFASDLLSDRWTFLILRELLIKPCRFGDLVKYLEGIGTNLLTTRLQSLEKHQCVYREKAEGKRAPYRLTDKGLATEATVLELIRFGLRLENQHPDFLHYDHWDVLALKALFNKSLCNKPLTVQFKSESFTCWVDVSPNGFNHQFGETSQPDLVINSTIAELNQQVKSNSLNKNVLLTEFVQCFSR